MSTYRVVEKIEEISQRSTPNAFLRRQLETYSLSFLQGRSWTEWTRNEYTQFIIDIR